MFTHNIATRLFTVICCLSIGGAGCSLLPRENTDALVKPTIQFAQEKTPTFLKRHLKRALKAEYQVFKQATLPATTRQQAAVYQETIEKLLLAEGYYASQLRQDQTAASATPLHWRITTGPRYKVSNISITPEPQDFELRAVLPRQLHILAPLRAETILAAEQALVTALEKNRCSWRIEVAYQVSLDHTTHLADIDFTIMPSPAVRVGSIRFSGLEQVPQSYLEPLMPLKSGGCFSRSAIQNARLSLLNTGLLSQVEAELTHNPSQGTVDIELIVRERAHRSVSASVGYSIDEKGSVSAGWTHRNFRQSANLLSVSGRYSSLLQAVDWRWVQPHVFGPTQNLSWEATVENEQIDAFDARNRLLRLTSEHQLRPHLLGKIGIALTRSDVIEDNQGARFELISLPMSLTSDRRDDLLNTRAGSLSYIDANTFWNLREGKFSFQKVGIGLHHYKSKPIFDRPLTLAWRLFMAGFTHLDTDTVPATEKFFAGGGGSVRGFAYKSLGPRAPGAVSADGGFSILEASVELRYRLSQRWGTVVFVDTGNTWARRTPRLTGHLPQSAGLGARFFTGFVPIRLDVAFPIKDPKGVPDTDIDRFQFYISIGQAF